MEIDIDKAIALILEYRDLNKSKLADVQFVRYGQPVAVDPVVLEEFRFTGLGNTDFIRSHFMGENFYSVFTLVKEEQPDAHDS